MTARAALVVLILAAIAPTGRSAQAAQAVDVALVLAADVSRSIDDEEFALQRRGYSAAISDPRVLEAIQSGRHGAIAITFVEWAGETEQKTVVDWTVIADAAAASKFASAIAEAPRSFLGRTAIGTAIDFSRGLIGESGFTADRSIIDVSGDGTNNQGRQVTEARNEAVGAQITINGLAIFNRRAAAEGGFLALHTNPPGGLAKYYRENVIGGSGAFVVQIDDFKTFDEAMIRKLISEISAKPPGVETGALPPKKSSGLAD
ncbi:MAG TPA: DUF1194 domain-containing protein [Roseiarcus sp.]